MQIKKLLNAEELQHVLWLHQEAYSGPDLPCVPCKGMCCRSCAAADGYLLFGNTKEERAALKRKYGWDAHTGYLTPTGCRLPVEERSQICVGFICDGHPDGEDRNQAHWFTLPALDKGMELRDILNASPRRKAFQHGA